MSDLKKKLTAQRGKVRRDTVTIEGVGALPVRGLTARELEEWRIAIRDTQKMQAELKTACLVQMGLEEDPGRLMYGPGEISQIADLPAEITEPISAKILELSGYGDVAVAALVKNSVTTSSGAGSSN